MKPASRTIYYVVYPPNYAPGDGYKYANNLKQAKRYARSYGIGAEIDGWVRVSNKRRRHLELLPGREYAYHGGKI